MASSEQTQKQPLVKIAVIGTGIMGSAVVRTLIAKGQKQVTVWNRTPEKAEQLVSIGATHAKTSIEAILASDIVLVTLVGDPDLQTSQRIFEAAEKELKGKYVVQLSSAEPYSTLDQEKWCKDRGIHFLSGAMMCSCSTLGTPTSVFYLSGAKHSFEYTKSTIELLAFPHYFGEDAGLAPLYDLAMLMTFFLGMQGHIYAVVAVQNYPGASLQTYTEETSKIVPLVLPYYLGIVTEAISSKGHTHDAKFWLPLSSTMSWFEMALNFCRKAGLTCREIEAAIEACKTVPESDRAKFGPSAIAAYVKKPATEKSVV